LYYLQSRYYNPEWGRFINADGITGQTGELLSHNMFAYCLNNPVNREDQGGYLSNWLKIGIGVVAIAVGVVATAITGGAAVPVLIASLEIAAGSAATSAAVSVVSNRMSTGSWGGSAQAAWDGAADGFMWGGVTSGAAAVGAAAKGIKIKQIGKLKPQNKDDGYLGIMYENKRRSLKSYEIHSPHDRGHTVWHYQQNTWNPRNMTVNSKKAKHWSLTFKRI
jgi:hypothetical protein